MLELAIWLALPSFVQDPDALRRETAALELVHELRMSVGQRQKLAGLAREADEIRAAFRRRLDTAEGEASTALAALRDALSRGCPHGADQERKATAEAGAALDELRAELRRTLKDVDRRLGNLLNGPQRARAAVWAARQGAPMPERLDADSRELLRHVELIRGLPKTAYEAIFDPLVDLLFERQEPWSSMSGGERREERARLRRHVEGMRAIGGMDFELNKVQLAYELLPMDDLGAPAATQSSTLKACAARLSPVGEALLAAGLTDRLARLADGGATCPTCAGPGERPESLSGEKPDFEELARWLGLSEEQFPRVEETLGRAQVEFLNALSKKDEEGDIPLLALFRMESDGGDPAELLGRRVPGEKRTYLQKAIALKVQIDLKLRRVLDSEQAERWKGAKVDVFGVRIIDLWRYE